MWQPINTAPRIEHEPLLGFDQAAADSGDDPQAGICIISWMEADEDGEYPADWIVRPINDFDCIVVEEARITHWMPIPNAPGMN